MKQSSASAGASTSASGSSSSSAKYTGDTQNVTTLRTFLIEHRTEEEFRALCIDLEEYGVVSYDQLPGETRQDKAAQLVRFMRKEVRNGLLILAKSLGWVEPAPAPPQRQDRDGEVRFGARQPAARVVVNVAGDYLETGDKVTMTVNNFGGAPQSDNFFQAAPSSAPSVPANAMVVDYRIADNFTAMMDIVLANGGSVGENLNMNGHSLTMTGGRIGNNVSQCADFTQSGGTVGGNVNCHSINQTGGVINGNVSASVFTKITLVRGKVTQK